MRGIRITDDIVIYNDMPKGWTYRKFQPSWHKKVYYMWRHVWKRVYTDIYYFGSLIHPSFRFLSNYVKWMESQPRFEEFCKTCDTIRWSVDKDVKHPGNKNYYPEYMSLITQSDNTKERINRNGTPRPKQPVIGVPLDDNKKVILLLFINNVAKYGFSPGMVSNCLRKKRKTHKRYRWYYVNYKHNKTLRKVI